MEQTTKRIEYIDALRGFCMYLVVFSHIWTFSYHADRSQSFASILVNFFLVLFFFVSGLVAYKKNMVWTLRSIGPFIKKKFIQLIIPAVFFCTIFCLWKGYDINAALAPSNAGYWFTIHLFYFFIFYTITNLISSKIGRGADVILLVVAMVIYAISYSHVMIERTQLGADLFHYLGMKNWRFYIFFCIGVLMRKHHDTVIKMLDNKYMMGAFVILFFFMVFYAGKIDFSFWSPICMLIYGGVSILVIYAFFRKYQETFSRNNSFGYWAQYAGKRTMDIYMIHYFLLPFHLDVMGKWFADNPNPAIEFFGTTSIACMVMALAMVIGNIIRLSPLLSYYLLGGKKEITNKESL